MKKQTLTLITIASAIILMTGCRNDAPVSIVGRWSEVNDREQLIVNGVVIKDTSFHENGSMNSIVFSANGQYKLFLNTSVIDSGFFTQTTYSLHLFDTITVNGNWRNYPAATFSAHNLSYVDSSTTTFSTIDSLVVSTRNYTR